MPNTPLSKVPYPSGTDAPAAAADMMGLVMAMDDRLVLKAVDEADRDSKYGEAPVSSLVVSGQSRKVWLKTGEGPTDWFTIYERQEYTEGFTVQPGWEIEYVRAVRNTSTTEVRIRVLRTGDDIIINSSGNFNDVKVMDLPPEVSNTIDGVQVMAPWRATRTGGTARITIGGGVWMCDGHSNSEVPTGESVWISSTWNN